jgi:hypothetical protein
MHRPIVIVAALACAALTRNAAAQEPPPEHFRHGGTLLFSADRLFGVSNYSVTSSRGGQDQTVSGTTANLLWGRPEISGVGSNPYTTPRLSFDYVVVDGVTVGGSLGYTFGSGKSESNGQASDRPSVGTLTFMARGGYVIPIGQHGIWLRGGFTYFNATTTSAPVNGAAQKSSVDGLSLALEPTFVFSPFAHVAFTAGVVVDFPLSGSQDQSGQSVDTKVTNYGAMVGVVTYF